MTDSTTPAAPPTLTAEQQTAVLNAEVATLSRKGWTVTSVAGNQGVLQRKKKLNALLHIILSIVTGGIWLIVVLFLVINRKTETKIVSVDAFGKVSVR